MIELSKYIKHTYQGIEYYTLIRENDILIIGEIHPNGRVGFLTTAKDGISVDDAIQAELDWNAFKKEALENKENILSKFEIENYFTYKGNCGQYENPSELHLLALEGEIDGEWKIRYRQKKGTLLSDREKKQFKWLKSMNHA